MSERLNPNSTLVCNLALRECRGEVRNDPKSLMNHFVKKHGWRKIPELVQREIDEHKPYPRPPNKVLTEADYLKLIEEHPEYWWFDNEFIWTDIRNLHFLHKKKDGLKSLRRYYRS